MSTRITIATLNSKLDAFIEASDARFAALEAENQAMRESVKDLVSTLKNQATAAPAKQGKGKAKKSDSINPEPTKVALKKEPAKNGNGYTVRLYTPEQPCPEVYWYLKEHGFNRVNGAWQHFYSEEHVEQARWAARNYRPATEAEKADVASKYTSSGQPKAGTMQQKRRNTKKNSK